MYKFVSTEKNIKSASRFEELKFNKINDNPIIYTFNIYNQPKIKPFIWPNCITLDEVTNEYKENARIKYDLEFLDYKTYLGDNVIGKITEVERPQLKDDYHRIFYGNDIACKPIKYDFKLDDHCCNGQLIIYEDNDALLMFFGSGIHYQVVIKGFVKKIK